MTQVINTTDHKVEVQISTPEGRDCVHIQPKGKVTLPPDCTIVPNWLALNPGVKIKDESSAVQVPAVASFKPTTKLEKEDK